MHGENIGYLGDFAESWGRRLIGGSCKLCDDLRPPDSEMRRLVFGVRGVG